MPAGSDMLDFPIGQVSYDGGPLADAYKFDLDFQSGTKVIATLRANPAGTVRGAKSWTVNISHYISENGPERNYLDKFDKGTIGQVQVKLPGGTNVTFNVTPATLKITVDRENPVMFDTTFVGKMVS